MTDTDVDPPDLARLYRAERDRLRRLAYLMTGKGHVAEEIVQDAFLQIHPRLSGVETPPAYLRATVVNLSLAWRRRTAMAREREPRPEPAWADPPELDETWDLLARLPADHRAVWSCGTTRTCRWRRSPRCSAAARPPSAPGSTGPWPSCARR